MSLKQAQVVRQWGYKLSIGLLLPIVACESPTKTAATEAAVDAPVAKVVPHVLSSNGHERVDNYYWLRERENPEVIAYLEAENKYTAAVLSHTQEQQEKLFKEIKNRIKEKDESAPYKDGDYYYYNRFEEGSEYPIYARKKASLEAAEEVLLNVNELAKGKSYYQAGNLEVSDSQQILAYAEDTVSRRLYTIRFKNLETGELFPDAIANTSGSVAWAADNKTVYYVKKDITTLLPFQVYKHVLGTDPASDEMVYEEKDNTFYTDVYRSKSEKYIMLYMSSTTTTEVRFIEADQPQAKPVTFLPRERGHEYRVEHFGDKFFIRSNWQAKNFRLMEVPVAKTAVKSAWKEVIPHRTDVYLEGMEVFTNHLVLEERKEGLLNLHIINWKDKSEHYLNFGEPAYTAYTDINPEMDTPKLRYAYTSLTTPNSIYEYDMNTKEKTLLKQQEVVGDFKAENYVTERVYATADDGTKIPISIVYKKGFVKDGSHPLYQYAYGSYGYSTNASFNSARLSLLDRGFAFAIAHIRGGQEMGRSWYEDGKLLKKKNTFTDFIDCSEFLIEQGYTSKDKLVASGGSAGGLLMGAVANMRPDLYKVMVAAVPFVDVVTTMLDESIPLTTGEYDEWGNPNQKEYYDYMLSYSPYDNVKAQDYPNMLVTTGLHDSQVQYWEPAKWVAKLRTVKTDTNRLLLHTNMEAGHGGASGRFKRYKDLALEYAFIFDVLGIEEKQASLVKN